jgi:hypothetical protein
VTTGAEDIGAETADICVNLSETMAGLGFAGLGNRGAGNKVAWGRADPLAAVGLQSARGTLFPWIAVLVGCGRYRVLVTDEPGTGT